MGAVVLIVAYKQVLQKFRGTILVQSTSMSRNIPGQGQPQQCEELTAQVKVDRAVFDKTVVVNLYGDD